jgi:hypothetical protein
MTSLFSPLPFSGTGTLVYPENRRACALLLHGNISDQVAKSQPVNATGQAETCPLKARPE